MSTTFKFKRGTTALWESKNTLLGVGEPGIELDDTTLAAIGMKVGTGSVRWVDLEYLIAPGGGGGGSSTYVGLSDKVTVDLPAINTHLATALAARLDRTADLSSQVLAEAGADNTKFMTPLRTAQAIAVLAPSGGGSIADGAVTTAKLADGAVTSAKIAAVGTKQYLGRTSAGTGAVENVPVATLKTDLGLVKGDVGLGNVDNTADASKPVSAAQAAAIATAIANLIASAPGALDTLNELAAALGNDANYAATITSLLAGKQAIDTDLTAIAALVSAANKLPYATGPGTWSLTDLSVFARTFLDDADAATVRGTIGALSAAAPSSTGIQTSDGASVTTPNAMGALAIDTSKGLNTKSIAADSTFTFSGAPATANTWFGLYLKNTDTNPHIVTMPSAFSQVTQAARTAFPMPASGEVYLLWRYDGAAYKVFGDSPYFNNYVASVAPVVTDDVAKGYGPGSLWYDATGNGLYINESNGSGAAVWTAMGIGDMVLASIQTVTGAKTFNDGKLKLAGSSSGAGILHAPAAASTYDWTLPAATTTLAGLAVGNVFTKGQSVAPVTLTSASGHIATDASLSNNFVVAALQENTQLDNPTNMVDSQILNWRLKNNGTGTYTIAYGSKFKWASGTAPTHTTGANKVDRVTGVYHAGDDVIEASASLDLH